MLELSHVTKSYGAHRVLNDLSFAVRPGRLTGFVGGNGAGKTTTMRIILGVLAKDAGSVTINGAALTSADRRRFGYMPEERGLYPKMKVGEHITYLARLHGFDKGEAETRATALLEQLGLGERLNDTVEKLSLGNQQRAQIAAALVHEPDVLILDEPTVGLDPKQIIEIREVIKGLGGDHTVILSTHILPEVSMTCGQLVIINNGRIAGEGTPESLMAQLKEGEVLRAHIDGPTDEIRAMLQGLEGVLDVSSEPGEGIYLVTSAPGQDVRDALTKQVVDGGYSLRELRPLDMTLEDIFLSLTSEEVAA